MEKVEPTLKPKDIYTKESPFNSMDIQQESLVACYLPIIGGNAFSLYEFFVLQEHFLASGPHTHGEILNFLNMGLSDFLQARKKLEAIGLLETFWHEKNGYLYSLKAPLTLTAFFQDEIFTQLLMDRIGQESVKEMVELQKKQQVDKNEYQRVTTTFQSVYPLSLETLQSNQKITEEIKNEFPKEKSTEEFDWIFFKDIVAQRGIEVGRFSREEKQELIRLVDVYGLNEFNLSHLVIESSDITTGKLYLKQLKEKLMASFNQTLIASRQVVEKPIIAKNDRVLRLRQKGFSEKEIQFIQAVEVYSPIQFLQISKRNLGGYLTKEEQEIVEKLRKDNLFPSSVINILIDYVLRINENGSLAKSYVDRIANNWAREKIQSPEEAILKVREVVEESKKPRSSKKAPVKMKEQLPDWAKNPVKETKINEEKAKVFKEKLKEFRESR